MLRVLLSDLGTKIHGIILFHISLNSCFIKRKANFGVSGRIKIKSGGVWGRMFVLGFAGAAPRGQ